MTKFDQQRNATNLISSLNNEIYSSHFDCVQYNELTQLARYLTKKWNPFADNTSSFLKSTASFASILMNHTCEETYLWVGFGMVFLFTETLLKRAVKAFRDIDEKYTTR